MFSERNILISAQYKGKNECKEDFSRICRTCLKTGGDVPLQELTSKSTIIKDLLENYASLNVSSNMLPSNICFPCKDQFENIETFIERCKEVNEYLKNILSTTGCENKVNNAQLPSQIQIDRNDLFMKDEDSCESLENSAADDDITEVDDRPSQNKDVKTKECPTCKKVIKSVQYRQHIRTHTKPFKCELEECNERFSQKTSMKRHMVTHTGEKPHVCEICGKGFTQSGTLNTHRKIHEFDDLLKDGTNIYSCSVCERTFKRLNCYREHVKKHDPNYNPSEKRNKEGVVYDNVCDVCNRTYKTKRLLKAHKLTHGEKTVLCNECGKKFYTKIALNSHLTVHTGEKKYKCNVCHKFFSQTSGLEVHMAIHRGEKKYKCTECDKAFMQLQHLKCHMTTHTRERNYKCHFCERAFAVKHNLSVHIRTHTGETPYKCTSCLYYFINSRGLKRHYAKYHGIEDNTHINSSDLQSSGRHMSAKFSEHTC